jgi:hypothetical protein
VIIVRAGRSSILFVVAALYTAVTPEQCGVRLTPEFKRQDNIEMEPTLLPVGAIMSP